MEWHKWIYILQKKVRWKSTYQNSGVHFDAHDENGNVQTTYYMVS